MNSKKKTFAQLDREKGIPAVSPSDDHEMPLPKWYQEVQYTPLEDLASGDLSRAIQQHVHLDDVVPVALEWLQRDIMAGDLYDGELAASFASVGSRYWAQHQEHAAQLKMLITGSIERFDEDVRNDAQAALDMIKQARRE